VNTSLAGGPSWSLSLKTKPFVSLEAGIPIFADNESQRNEGTVTESDSLDIPVSAGTLQLATRWSNIRELIIALPVARGVAVDANKRLCLEASLVPPNDPRKEQESGETSLVSRMMGEELVGGEALWQSLSRSREAARGTFGLILWAVIPWGISLLYALLLYSV